MAKTKYEKPRYDYSYLKEVSSSEKEKEGEILYDHVREILYDFEVGIDLDRIISLFEKGFLVYLRFSNKLEEFFKNVEYKPNIYELVLPSKSLNIECQKYLKNHFHLDYKLLLDVSKKHKKFQNASFNDKQSLLTLIFSFLVKLTKLVINKDVEMPSNELIAYLSFIETTKEKEIRRKLTLAQDAFDLGDYDICARYHALLDNQKMVDKCLKLFSLKILFQRLKADFITKDEFLSQVNRYTKQEFNIVKKHFEPFEVIVEVNEEHKRVDGVLKEVKALLKEDDPKAFVKAYQLIQKDEDKLGFIRIRIPEILKLFDKALMTLISFELLNLGDVKAIFKLKVDLFEDRIIDYCLENIEEIDDDYLSFIKAACEDEQKKEIFLNELIKRQIAQTNALYEAKNYDKCLEMILSLNSYVDAKQRGLFADMRIDCLYFLCQFKELDNLFRQEFYKHRIISFVENVIHDDADIRREINHFRTTSIEKYIINRYLIEKKNEEIDNTEEVDIDQFFLDHKGTELEYTSFVKEQYKIYNEVRKNTVLSVKRKELIKTLVLAGLSLILMVLAIILLVTEAGMPYEEKSVRVFFTVIGVILTVISLGFSTFHLIKLVKNSSKDHGLENKFNKKNDEYLSIVKQNTYPYKIALFYGFLLKKDPEFTKYPQIQEEILSKDTGALTTKFLVNGLGVICLVLMVSTHNSFMYKKLENNIYNFKSSSLNEFEYSLKKLPKRYKDIASIKEEYQSISKDVLVASAFTDKNDIDAHHEAYSSEAYIANATNVPLSETALGAYNNVQCFMYRNYEFDSKNKYNKYSWDFTPILNEINMYYLINGKTLKVQSGGEGYLMTTPTSYSTNLGSESSGQFTYAFKNGVLTLYAYEKGDLVKKWTLSNFTFIDTNKAKVFAVSQEKYETWLEVEY